MLDSKLIDRWSREQLLKLTTKSWNMKIDEVLNNLRGSSLISQASTYPKGTLIAVAHLACKTEGDFSTAQRKVLHFLNKSHRAITWISLTDAISKAANSIDNREQSQAHQEGEDENSRLRSTVEKQQAEIAALTSEGAKMRKQAVRLVAEVVDHFANDANVTLTTLGYNSVFDLLPRHLAAKCRTMLDLGVRFDGATGDEDSAIKPDIAEEGGEDMADTAESGSSEAEDDDITD